MEGTMEVLVHVHRREQLLPRRPQADSADARSDDDRSESGDDAINGGYENGISDGKSVYFDNDQGIWKCHHCIWTHKIGQSWIYHLHQKPFYQGDHKKIQWPENNMSAVDQANISKLVSAVMNNHQNAGNFEDEILSVSTPMNISEKFGVNENVRVVNVVEESGSDEDEEEEIELEFENAVEKVHTHTPYCPNCSNRITKVILRRKIKKRADNNKPLNLLGCFSCFSVFIPSGDRLNPFGLFKSKPKLESPKVEGEQPLINEGGTTNASGTKPKPESSKGEPSTNLGSTSTNAAGLKEDHRPCPFNFFGFKPKVESTKLEVEKPSSTNLGSTTTNAAGQAKPELHPPSHVTYDIEAGLLDTDGGRPSEIDNVNINIVTRQPIISGNQRSKSFEILKCIVYGGLIESIASLSVVSSAAASDVTTLNVIVIGLATVFGGLSAFGCNLLELRNDSSNNKYEEELGRRGHFLLHSTFAILSYLVFGLIAPTTYAFAFNDEGDNKDYKILAVAAAAFASVFVLAIAKAYVKGTDKFSGYCKTTSYYVTLAVSASGVAYVAGHMFGIFLDNLGWFDQSAQDVTPSLVSAAWASY